MPFSKIMGKRDSLNLEELRKQEWGQNYVENFTLRQVSRPLNGDTVMVSTQLPERQTVDWGEEKEDGAIYHVVLRRVRYHTTNKLPYDSFVSYLEWETHKRRTLKAGTLVKLIEQLLPENEIIDEVDPGYLIAFLTMYHTFATSAEVVSGLFERLRTVKKITSKSSQEFENVLRGTVRVLLVWLEHFPNDFMDTGCESLKQIKMFAISEMKENFGQELLKKAQQLLDKVVITPFDMADHSPSSSFNDSSNDGSSFFSETSGLLDFEPSEIAEQLTLVDAELFKAVVARHCVGCIWSRRDKNDNNNRTSSVKATVNQFNAVSHRVTSTILVGGASRSPNVLLRPKRIEAWIQIAQECRELKNFSSLKAIVSALQSVSIHRLKKTWSSVSRYHISLFEELSKLVSEESNQQTGREVLKREGTAKTVEPSKKKSLTRSFYKKYHKSPNNGYMISGTVPYLGTFLTDLMMLDAAYPDLVDGNLINFEKRQKEFEIIAQIRLFQESAKNYHIMPNETFRIWFASLETLTEKESFNLSCSLETQSLHKRQTSLFRSRKMKSENDLASVGRSQDDGPSDPGIPDRCFDHRRQDSTSNSNISQDSSSSTVSEGSSNCSGTGYIVRVSIEGKNSCNMYKSIWLSDGIRTSLVIKSCLLKHDLDPELSINYNLVQILPHGNEITIPNNENVYYAINTKSQPLSFILRKIKR